MQGDTIVQHYWPGTCSRTLPGPAGSLDTQHARQNFNRRERQKERGRQARGLALRRRAMNYVTRRMLITKSAFQSMFRSEKLCKSSHAADPLYHPGLVRYPVFRLRSGRRPVRPRAATGGWSASFAEVLLLGLVFYSLALYCQPLLEDEGEGLIWAFLLLLGIAVVKIALLPLLPGLGIDVGSYQSWAMRMVDVGPARMYETGYFLDYPPGYLYLLWAAGAAGHALGLTGEMLRAMVESPAIIGDLLLGRLDFRDRPASRAGLPGLRRDGAVRAQSRAALRHRNLGPERFDPCVADAPVDWSRCWRKSTSWVGGWRRWRCSPNRRRWP